MSTRAWRGAHGERGIQAQSFSNHLICTRDEGQIADRRQPNLFVCFELSPLSKAHAHAAARVPAAHVERYRNDSVFESSAI
jgi:hypothetical protein